MKLDATIKLKKPGITLGTADGTLKVPIDEDYVGAELDDVIKSVEAEIWQRHGVALSYGVDFDIENVQDLLDDLGRMKGNQP